MLHSLNLANSLMDRKPIMTCIGKCKKPIQQSNSIKLLNGFMCTACLAARMRAVSEKTEPMA